MPSVYSRPYVYSFWQIFQSLRLFPALHLFLTLDSRVVGDLISKFLLVELTLCTTQLVRFFPGPKHPGDPLYIYIPEMIITNWKMVKNQIQWKLP